MKKGIRYRVYGIWRKSPKFPVCQAGGQIQNFKFQENSQQNLNGSFLGLWTWNLILVALLFLIPLYFIPDISLAQQTKIDSLVNLLKIDKEDSNKVNHLAFICKENVLISNYDTALYYGNAALQLSLQLSFRQGIATSYHLFGIIHDYQSNYPEALKYFSLSLKIREEMNDKKGIANSLNSIGIIYEDQGNYPEALNYFLNALKIREEMDDKSNIAVSYNNIGIIYEGQGNYDEALKNYLTCLQLSEKLDDKQFLVASVYNNIGNIYLAQFHYPEALKNYFLSLKIREEMGDKEAIAASHHNIGIIYNKQGNYQEALNNYFISLKLKEEIGDQQGLAYTLVNLGSMHIEFHKHKEARKYLNRALQVSKEIGDTNEMKESYHGLSALDSATGNYKSAYENYKLFIGYRDRLLNEENTKKILRSQMTYHFEKKEAATKAEHDKQTAVATEKNRRQQLFIWFIAAVATAIAVIAVVVFRALRVTRTQKRIIEAQKKIVDEKNQNIIDSIEYAKKIQYALLIKEGHVSPTLPEHFILFKPKDIVSGDFYWALEKKDWWYIAAADCTGHGVPGAFMMMLITALLNEITGSEQILTPAEILNEVRGKIIKELGQHGKAGETKDGMDVSFSMLNLKTKELQWAGANNPLYLVKSSGQLNLSEIEPDYFPVGIHIGDPKPFTLQTLKIEKGDMVYLVTDGFEDQFGGEKNKKFKSSRLREVLLSIATLPIPEQKKVLEKTFDDWRMGREQTDDVTVIGIRV